NGRPGKSVIPPRSSLQGQQDISPPIHLIHGVPHVNIGGQWVEVVTHENAPPPVRKQQQRKTEEPMPVLQVNDQVASKPRTHWLLYIGIVMLLMLVGWTLVTMFLSWWQVTTDDWHYGRPRSYQVDQRVGHGDAAIPSHFIAMNLAHHVQV